MNTLISQKLTAGNDFDGSAPSGGSSVDDGSRVRHYDLTAGGLFDFGFNQSVRGQRILLSLGDAADWSLSIRTTDGNGVDEDFVLYELSDFDVNDVSIHGRNLFVLDANETLILTTTGATSEMFASITVSR